VIRASKNNKQNLDSKSFTGCDFYPLDITNIESIRDVITDFKPNAVIHGAATKFVDLAEKIPNEIIDVNVLGTHNVARVAMHKGTDLVIGISTDKATPSVRNIYGLAKT
jgi:UDP-glucose 4-epimerase